MEHVIEESIKEEKFSINTTFTDDFSKEIYEQTYKYGDEDINKTQLRVAKDLAKIEKDKEYWTQQFLWLQENFRFVPGGRITSNAGTGLKGTTYINCFTPDTKVLTNKGYKPIVDIEIGDMVLTHKGRYKPVVSLMKKQHADSIVCFKSPSISDVIKTTLEHPFYQGNNEWVQAEFIDKLYLSRKDNSENEDSIDRLDIYEYVKDVTRKDGRKSIIADNEFVYSTSEWENPQGGRIVSRNKAKTKRFVDVDEDFAYFIGRFIGDGSTFCVNGTYEVDGFNIAFSKKEIDAQIKLKSIIDENFGIDVNINDSNEFKGTYIRKNNIVVANFLCIACGRYSDTKHIPDFIWNSSLNVKLAFFRGLIDADGTITPHEAKITLNNENLIDETQVLLQLCNIPSNKGVELINDKPYYRLSLVRQYASAVILASQKVYEDGRIEEYGKPIIEHNSKFKTAITCESNQIDGAIFYTDNIEKWQEQYDGYVYNISVLDDESYVVNNVVVHNCFVDGFMGEDQDSLLGIMQTLQRQAMILKSEGGYGVCADVMRPRGAFVYGIGSETPGAVEMLDMWDTQSAVITKGSGQKTKKKQAKVKIRKGAQMVTMSVWHPDIEEFITAKLTSGRLTKFNMSVLATDEFMDAVEHNKPWNLEFPDYENNKEDYKKYWNGNLKEWKARGFNTVVYKTFENANELWEIIMKSTYNRNEPGVLFVDTMNRLNNLYYNEYISATNPCGEQILPIGGVCLLGSINLTQFVNFKKKDWDYEGLAKVIPIAVRFMDNVNDVTYVPLESQKDNLKNKRRIGLGIMGYGSALMMMKVRYGSEKALELTEKLYNFFANTAYQASSKLAEEKGTFNLFDVEKFLAGNFVKVLSKETRDMIRRYGLRNSHLLSIQPTGNSSVFANNVSGGLEPIFLPEYIRTAIMPYAPEGLDKPKNINWDSKTFESTTEWLWTKEGDESLLKTSFGGFTWKFDKSRGLLRETLVQDYAVRYLAERGEWDVNAEWAATTTQLSIDEHVKTMAVMAKYIDSAMSKTVNLPNDYPFDDFKRLYMECYKTGVIKGATTYRAGTMTSVLSSTDKKEDGDGIKRSEAPKRPKTLVCDIHNVTVAGEKWLVLVGILGKDPYEVFALKKSKGITLSDKVKKGKLTRVKSGHYDLTIGDGDVELENIGELFETDEQEALTRMISNSLQHGSDIKHIYKQLQKSQGNILSFSKAIARTLKKYLTDVIDSEKTCQGCGDPEGIVLQEGCFKCKSCGYSRC
jgi:ribonucleoside-diphosphate reductase alpha chain